MFADFILMISYIIIFLVNSYFFIFSKIPNKKYFKFFWRKKYCRYFYFM